MKKPNTSIRKMLDTIFKKNICVDTSIKSSKDILGIVNKVNIIKKKSIYIISIYITEKRKIQIGDKMAGRHGNKGIVSKILPREEMPYLQDGTPLDILLNPLGIPSRMNVGQIFECMLTLAAKTLHEKYRILPFDENQQSNEVSKTMVYKKLKEAKEKTNNKWLFNPNYPGKVKLIDGKTGKIFTQPVLIGYAYILKLLHMVDDKINSRSTGPYTAILKQPVRGKSRNGGQRLGEMEVWAVEGYGAAYTLQEMLTLKSDDLNNRSKILFNIVMNKNLPQPNIPESMKTLILELQCLCMDIKIYSREKKDFFL